MSNFYEISVIGESKVKNTIWISSLFQKNITNELLDICMKNENGHSTIPISYVLKNTEMKKLMVDNIEWDIRNLVIYLYDTKRIAAIDSLIEKLAIPTPTYPLQKEDLLRMITHFKSDNYKKLLNTVNAYEIISLLNDDKISDMNIIQQADISGPISDIIGEFFEDTKIDSVKINDINISLNNDESKHNDDAESLIDSFDIYNAQACIFISDIDSLTKGLSSNLYSSVIRTLYNKFSLTLMIQDETLTNEFRKNTNILYDDAVKAVTKSESYIALQNLLKECLALSKKQYDYTRGKDCYISLSQRYFTKFILPDIQKSEWRLNKSFVASINELASAESFKYVICKTASFVENSQKVLESLRNLHTRKEELLMKLFNEKFNMGISYMCPGLQSTSLFVGKKYYPLNGIAQEIKGPLFLDSSGRGLLGVRGGLTTWYEGSGKVGQIVIDFLEAAYQIRKELNKEIVNKLEPYYGNHIKTILGNDDSIDISKEIKCLKQNFSNKLENELEDSCEALYMLDRKYLCDAYNKTHEILHLKSSQDIYYLEDIDDCFKNKGNDNICIDDEYYVSIFKQMLWQLVSLNKIPENIGTPVLAPVTFKDILKIDPHVYQEMTGIKM